MPAPPQAVFSPARAEVIPWPLPAGTPLEYVTLDLRAESSPSDRTHMTVASAAYKREPLLMYADARSGDWTVEILDGAGKAVCTRHMRSPRSYEDGVADETPRGARFVDVRVAFELRCPVPAAPKTIRISGPSGTLAKNDPRRVADDKAIVVIGVAPYPAKL